MPGIDGWQLLQRMQERHGSIPVIMFSGQVDARRGPTRRERGARDFVGKPFDPRQLDRAREAAAAGIEVDGSSRGAAALDTLRPRP